MEARQSSLKARLLRLGFLDTTRAESIIAARLQTWSEDDVDVLGLAGDPDQALGLLERLPDPILKVCADDAIVRDRLVRLLGVSIALGEHLIRHPEHIDVISSEQIVIPDRRDMCASLIASLSDGLVGLRIAYRKILLAIATRDVMGEIDVETVGEALADAADSVLEAALVRARQETPGQEQARLSIIAMGKCGARELNYISDVDVIFVGEPVDGADETAALAVATRLATSVMNACSEATPEGTIWEVDAALRPEGKNGALVRTLASHTAYYQRFASTWEFQALLKARHAAGDEQLGLAYAQAMEQFIWSAAGRKDFVENARAMRRRVEEHIPSKEAAREIKLGVGGLRDVEFSVQLLQLVHGRSDVMLRKPGTLIALAGLAEWGYVGREDAAALSSAYRFMRTLEHRIQLHRLRRTHLLPENDADLRRLGRSLGFAQDPADALMTKFRQTQMETRRIHEKLFYRPLLDAVSRLTPGDARLTPEAAGSRLEALGYRDPQGALRHIEALTTGVSRRAAIQRTLLPVLLGWFAQAPDPDAGLLGFRQISDALGSTHWYLRLLRDESASAERLARILASSRYATDLLLRAPEAVAMLADDGELRPRDEASIAAEMRTAVGRHEDSTTAIVTIRALRRRELFRIAAADILGTADVEQVSLGLSAVARATLTAALDVACASVGEHANNVRFLVVAMGRLGGREVGYGSDADVMFVHEAAEGVTDEAATQAAFAIANALRTLLMVPSADPAVEVDADLRPEGKQGPLVRSLSSYAAYYQRWSAPWESQALLRAEPLAGDESLRVKFLSLIEDLRWPRNGIDDGALREIRRLKARMENERLPRGADPTLHTKLGRGGLSDVEWVAQLLQMQHAGTVQSLRTTRTVDALHAAVDAGLLDRNDAQILIEAWRLSTRIRNAIMLMTNRAADSIPTGIQEVAGLAALVGGITRGPDLVEHYRRITRRARTVVDRVFYGITPQD